jgi:hypothetical protein
MIGPEGPAYTAQELNIDVSAEGARALHRVVRAMHDGHCPKCGYLGPADAFYHEHPVDGWHECPTCQFRITETEARGALLAFKPHFQKSLEVFEAWRTGYSV